MARQQSYPTLETLRKLEACLRDHACHGDEQCTSQADAGSHASSLECIMQQSWINSIRLSWKSFWYSRRLRNAALFAGGISAAVLVAMLALWWRLSSGPLELDMAT